MSESRIVQLPADLCAAAEKKFGHLFGNLEELLTFILREVTMDDAVKADQAEERMIEDRLKELGYL
ncbi:MAG TPA: hypothetical protein VKB49_27460 [Candidatus Sulfotelmatobacter sp.]|nr:hypothetical protein [Candidatus Sulfotelmatobacter sp.]